MHTNFQQDRVHIPTNSHNYINYVFTWRVCTSSKNSKLRPPHFRKHTEVFCDQYILPPHYKLNLCSEAKVWMSHSLWCVQDLLKRKCILFCGAMINGSRLRHWQNKLCTTQHRGLCHLKTSLFHVWRNKVYSHVL